MMGRGAPCQKQRHRRIASASNAILVTVNPTLAITGVQCSSREHRDFKKKKKCSRSLSPVATAVFAWSSRVDSIIVFPSCSCSVHLVLVLPCSQTSRTAPSRTPPPLQRRSEHITRRNSSLTLDRRTARLLIWRFINLIQKDLA